MSVRGYVSTCFVCPYEGPIAKEKAADVTRALFELGVDEVSIGDTIGAATPPDVERTCGYLLQQFIGYKLAMHFHDTYGMAIANVYQSLQIGFRSPRHQDRGFSEIATTSIALHRTGTGTRPSIARLEDSSLMPHVCESRFRVRYAETDQMGVAYRKLPCLGGSRPHRFRPGIWIQLSRPRARRTGLSHRCGSKLPLSDSGQVRL